MASDLADVEAFAGQVYEDINRVWAARKNCYPTWELGFRILYSRPIYRPKIMIVGENPGCLPGQIYCDREHTVWPTKSEYVAQDWALALKLQSLFSQIGSLDALEGSVGLNVNFFRSHSNQSPDVGLRWRANPLPIRRELEAASIQKVFGLITVMKPTFVLALGMTAFDALTKKTGTAILTRASDRARLFAVGKIFGITVAGIIHPTGARVSNEDWQRILPQVRVLMAD